MINLLQYLNWRQSAAISSGSEMLFDVFLTMVSRISQMEQALTGSLEKHRSDNNSKPEAVVRESTMPSSKTSSIMLYIKIRTPRKSGHNDRGQSASEKTTLGPQLMPSFDLDHIQGGCYQYLTAHASSSSYSGS